MNRASYIGIVLASILVSGCATAPENISPTEVNSTAYQSWSCGQLEAEDARLTDVLGTEYNAQRTARTNDEISVFFVGLPMASISGDNMKKEIGDKKGQQEAVQHEIILKNCTAATTTNSALMP